MTPLNNKYGLYFHSHKNKRNPLLRLLRTSHKTTLPPTGYQTHLPGTLAVNKCIDILLIIRGID